MVRFVGLCFGTLVRLAIVDVTLRVQGDHAGAHRLQEQVLEVRTRVLGRQHPKTLTSMRNLALTLCDAEKHADALQMLRECLDCQRQVLGDEHADTIATEKFITQIQN
jgi:hypothetical protein